MANIICVGGVKGGTGKSTIATLLATAFAFNGMKNLFIDADPQGSSESWYKKRKENKLSIESVEFLKHEGHLDNKEIKEKLKRYELSIIDTGGRDSIELHTALLISTALITPVNVSFFDAISLRQTYQRVKETRKSNPRLKWVLVFNKVTPKRNTLKDIAELEYSLDQLRGDNRVFRSFLYSRVAYQRCVEGGKSLYEYRDKKARNEFEYFYDELIELLLSLRKIK